MITLKDKQKILLEAILEDKPQRQVARETKISRTTIGKYLENYEDVKSKLMGSDDIKLKEDRIWAALSVMALNSRKLLRDMEKSPELIYRFG